MGTIVAFGKNYIFNERNIQSSNYLKTLFGGSFREKNEVELDIDPDLEPAFNYLYDYLTQELQDVPVKLFSDIVFLASFFGIEDLLTKLVNVTRFLPLQVLLSCSGCLAEPDVKEAIFYILLDKVTDFADLPKWAQNEFMRRQTGNFPEVQGLPLYLFLEPLPEKTSIEEVKVEYDESYNRRCHLSRRPGIITLVSVPKAQELGKVYLNQGNLYLCSGKNQTLRKNAIGEFCCYPRSNPEDLKELPSRYKAMMAHTKDVSYPILLPQKFVGDYIYTESYDLVPQQGIIVSGVPLSRVARSTENVY